MSTLLDQLLDGIQQVAEEYPTTVDGDVLRFMGRLLSDDHTGYSDVCSMLMELYDTINDATDKVGRLPVDDSVTDAMISTALLTVVDVLHTSLAGVPDSDSLVIDDGGCVLGTMDGVGKSIRSLFILLEMVFQWGAISGAVGQRDGGWKPAILDADKRVAK